MKSKLKSKRATRGDAFVAGDSVLDGARKIGLKIKSKVDKCDGSRDSLCEQIGISRKTLLRLEKGENVGIHCLLHVMQAIGMTSISINIGSEMKSDSDFITDQLSRVLNKNKSSKK